MEVTRIESIDQREESSAGSDLRVAVVLRALVEIVVSAVVIPVAALGAAVSAAHCVNGTGAGKDEKWKGEQC